METTLSSSVDEVPLDRLLVKWAPSNCNSELIDFSRTPLPEYSNYFAILIENLLTPAECAALLNAAQSTTGNIWEQAMVNIGGGRQMLDVDSRNCGRIIWDDKVLAARLRDRILPHLPPEIVTLKDKPDINGKGPVKRKETWRISRLNDRLRFLKYTHGMYFRPHCDGSYATPDESEISYLTVHLYLSGGDIETGHRPGQYAERRNTHSTRDELPLEGGATRFFSHYGDRYFDINPVAGACLVFQHRGLVHSGEEVTKGTKYTMRTDIMYEKVAPDVTGEA